MTDQYILSIDPGKSSGIALLAYNDKEVWLEGSWQFEGGADGLRDWVDLHFNAALENPEDAFYDRDAFWNFSMRTKWSPHPDPLSKINPSVICEAFTARATQGFSYTTDSLEALVAIGVLVDKRLVNRSDKKWYRDPKLQYLVGGKDKADKKKRQHRFLKDSGFYVAPSALGMTDADDFRSACAHGLAYLQRELKHRGVHAMVSEWMEKNG